MNLERTPERNLIRNSGQYWKALGLLKDSDGRIELTPLGHDVASGDVTPLEFSIVTILTLALPNPVLDAVAEWKAAGLSIKPLRLILEVLVAIGNESAADAYLTPRELYQVVVPLAGVPGNQADLIAEALLLRRGGELSLDGWPDCAPRANDRRMAREFLLFLDHYGHLERRYIDGEKDDERFYLRRTQMEATSDLLALRASSVTSDSVQQILSAPQIATVERQRRIANVIARPQQHAFRKRVLRAADYRCAITEVCLPEVLEAAHIVPVSSRGTDKTDNGLCLRADLHSLFDAGHLRIRPDGLILLSGSASVPANYGGNKLPHQISIPDHVGVDNLQFRWRYL
ncbi:MAG: HNH endonuclease [Armatimonadota bacterium]